MSKKTPKNKKKGEVQLKSEGLDNNDSMDPQQLLNLGIQIYFGKDGSTQDTTKGLNLVKSAADRGQVDAMHFYAKQKHEGELVPKDCIEASKYYKMAADKGHSESQNLYSVMLFNGDGIDQNFTESARYFKMASDQG